MIEMTIDSIRVSLMNYQRVVILKEKGSDRYLPIWIGPAEADSIAVKLQDVAVPRPLTHDLLGSVIARLGAHIQSIVVTDLSDDTFYAKIILQTSGADLELDSRPSDAIALAVRARVPIYAENSVLDKAGIQMNQEDEDTLGSTVESGQATKRLQVNDEELEKLSAFKDFVNELDLESLDAPN